MEVSINRHGRTLFPQQSARQTFQGNVISSERISLAGERSCAGEKPAFRTSGQQQVPRLRVIFRFAENLAPLGMTAGLDDQIPRWENYCAASDKNVRPTRSDLDDYSICTSSLAVEAFSAAGRWGSRQQSKIDTWCTQETVQCGAQDFSVRYSRWKSSIVYLSSGIAG